MHSLCIGEGITVNAFFGRQKEIARIRKAVGKGNNFILSGQYGIGRTRLIRHIAALDATRRQFVFGDFSETAGKACREIYARLGLDKTRTRFKGRRYRIANRYPESERGRLVLVLDNIGKLTHQKLNFVRFLTVEGNVQIIAIAESFLPEKELFLLRAALTPVEFMTLHRLDLESVCEIFRSFSRKRTPSWSEEYIRTLAQLCRGYPLLITERLAACRRNDMEKRTDGSRNRNREA